MDIMCLIYEHALWLVALVLKSMEQWDWYTLTSPRSIHELLSS